MSQEPSNTNDAANPAFADTEPPPESRLLHGNHPDCPICMGKIEYIDPHPGDVQSIRISSEFPLSPGTHAGWHLAITFHGRRTMSQVWTMQLALQGRAERIWMKKPDATRPHEGTLAPNVPGPILLRSCEGTGPDVWRNACRGFEMVLGSTPRIRSRHEPFAPEPTIKVGSFLIMGRAGHCETLITLPIAHLAHYYVSER